MVVETMLRIGCTVRWTVATAGDICIGCLIEALLVMELVLTFGTLTVALMVFGTAFGTADVAAVVTSVLVSAGDDGATIASCAVVASFFETFNVDVILRLTFSSSPIAIGSAAAIPV